jgi:hypothetical protein
MPTLEIWSPLATATLIECGTGVCWRFKSTAVAESMKLCVEPESRSARKSLPLIDSWAYIVWLVVIPVTACNEI